MTHLPLTVRPLDTSTWPDFARLAEANNGVFGGCWCTAFHPKGDGGGGREANRSRKQAMVEGGAAHAALVPAGFLYNGALSTYERLGFVRDRRIGTHRWVVRTTVAAR